MQEEILNIRNTLMILSNEAALTRQQRDLLENSIQRLWNVAVKLKPSPDESGDAEGDQG